MSLAGDIYGEKSPAVPYSYILLMKPQKSFVFLLQNASLCVAALAISSEREEAIDFTKPYKAKTLTVLVKRTPESRSIFEFLYPLAFEVWALMFCAMIGLGILLFLLDLAIPNSTITDERFSLKVRRHNSGILVPGPI